MLHRCCCCCCCCCCCLFLGVSFWFSLRWEVIGTALNQSALALNHATLPNEITSVSKRRLLLFLSFVFDFACRVLSFSLSFFLSLSLSTGIFLISRRVCPYMVGVGQRCPFGRGPARIPDEAWESSQRIPRRILGELREKSWLN